MSKLVKTSCSHCHGSGVLKDVDESCSRCNGNGLRRNIFGNQVVCTSCGGSGGFVGSRTCSHCDGSGQTWGEDYSDHEDRYMG